MTFLPRLPEHLRGRARRLFAAAARGARPGTPAALLAEVAARTLADLETAEARREHDRASNLAVIFHAIRGRGDEALELAKAALAEAEQAVELPFTAEASLGLDRARAAVNTLTRGAA